MTVLTNAAPHVLFGLDPLWVATVILVLTYAAVITEEIAVAGLAAAGFPGSPTPATMGAPPPLRLRFQARDFFQNNPFILPAFAGYVRAQAAAASAHFLIDAYCGSGLFSVFLASFADRVIGIELSVESVRYARINAESLGAQNVKFIFFSVYF